MPSFSSLLCCHLRFCGVFSVFSKNSRAKTLFRTFLMLFRRFYKVFTALFDAFSVFSAHPATLRRGLSPMLIYPRAEALVRPNRHDL